MAGHLFILQSLIALELLNRDVACKRLLIIDLNKIMCSASKAFDTLKRKLTAPCLRVLTQHTIRLNFPQKVYA